MIRNNLSDLRSDHFSNSSHLVALVGIFFRYPLNIFNSAKRSPRGGLRFPLLNGSNGHQQLHQPIAWIWWKKWCIWENQLISRNLTWISTTKSRISEKATSERVFTKKMSKNASRSSENGDVKTYRYRGGGPYEWTEYPCCEVRWATHMYYWMRASKG